MQYSSNTSRHSRCSLTPKAEKEERSGAKLSLNFPFPYLLASAAPRSEPGSRPRIHCPLSFSTLFSSIGSNTHTRSNMSNTNAATSNANLLSPTTAAAAAAAAKPAGNKLRRPAPSPAGPRVKRNHPFPAWNLIKVPIRVLQPPAATGMVGSVRSFSATPLSDVKVRKNPQCHLFSDLTTAYDRTLSSHFPILACHARRSPRPFSFQLADVIANKHLSPLSLKDFEGYLVFKEHSAESLYFILCEC